MPKMPRILPHVFQSEDGSSHFIVRAPHPHPEITPYLQGVKDRLEKAGTSGRLFMPGEIEEPDKANVQGDVTAKSPVAVRAQLTGHGWFDLDDDDHRQILYPEPARKAKGGKVKGGRRGGRR